MSVACNMARTSYPRALATHSWCTWDTCGTRCRGPWRRQPSLPLLFWTMLTSHLIVALLLVNATIRCAQAQHCLPSGLAQYSMC